MKILFCALDSYGFINPLIGLAKELENLGYETAFVCDYAIEPYIEAEGLRRISRSRRDGNSFLLKKWYEPLLNAVQVKHIEYALQKFPADLLVGSPLALGPIIAAERYSLKLVNMGFFPYLWSTPTIPKDMPDKQVALHQWATREWLEVYNRTRRLFKLPKFELNENTLPFLGQLYMQRSSYSTSGGVENFPSTVQLVGSCLWERKNCSEARGLDAWLNKIRHSDRKIIYINHGRSFKLAGFWNNVISSFRNSNYLIVASSDRMDVSVGEVPDNFYVRPYVPQGNILPMAEAVISSGNTTATLGALETGIPSLIIPGGGETRNTAYLCRKAGVARTITSDEFSRTCLRSELEILLENRRYAKNCKKVSNEFSTFKGFGCAANLVSNLLTSTVNLVSNQSGSV